MRTAPPVRTTCPYCGTGCGVLAHPLGPRAVNIAGDGEHPASFGRLCVKGAALGETVGLTGRLLHPMRRSSLSPAGDEPAKPPQLQRISWSDALDEVAAGFAKVIREHGPQAVALYVSGQLLTEDYYAANKFVKGFLGTANIDTNSRLCMSAAVAGHKRAFGEDIVPVSYTDLEQADLIVLVGSNTAWCHPVMYQRMLKAKELRPSLKLVVIDPRRTPTAEIADLHLPIAPGSDVRLFNGLLQYLQLRGCIDRAFVQAHTAGLDAALAVAQATSGTTEATAAACGLDAALLSQFFDLFAAHERVVTAFSMGVNQSSSGADKVNAIINCHLLTGRIGKPGAGPFSITGQPNAMGGREVGGLANMLAAHMDIENAEHRDTVQAFWRSPAIASKSGLKAVDLFQAVERGEIKALWIMATNPVVSLPDADQVKRALAACDLVVVSDVMEQTDTSAYADLLLPALGWGEKDGTVTNSERCISRQRAFLPAPGEARADWWMIAEVARRLGWGEAFDWRSAHEIFDEHARLSAFRNEGRRYFDIGALAGQTREAYDALAPLRWPVAVPVAHAAPAEPVFSDGRYYHPDGRARFVAVEPKGPAHAPDDQYPLILNTGRVRDHWHTMTRTGLAPKLATHVSECYVDMHADDAQALGLREQQLARVSTRWGEMVARVRLGGEMQRGQIFVPIHWNNQFASNARVGALVNPVVDPVSGEPEFKHTPARVEAVPVQWRGFAIVRQPAPELQAPAARFSLPSGIYWTRITGALFGRFELAGVDAPLAWPQVARQALGDDASAQWLEFEDAARGSYRLAKVVDGQLEACLFISRQDELPARSWLSSLFARPELDDDDRYALLAGDSPQAGSDAGATICSCFGVGRNTIVKAIRERGLKSAAEVTACLKAGGNCGSCLPEVRKLVQAEQLRT